jgi:NADP-dependent 3-hydroxy acid dehydrogenase YdfG
LRVWRLVFRASRQPRRRAARRPERIEAAAHELRGTGGEAIAVAMDVQDEASTIAACDAACTGLRPG